MNFIIFIPIVPSSSDFNPILIIIPVLILVYILIIKTNIFSLDKKSNAYYKKDKKYYSIEDKYNTVKIEKERELNQLLEKINKKGINNLSAKEKRRLDELSK
ncbi:hypothetical protein LXD69_16170 [Flavobacterium sediminilitoris]|uniref:DUF6576 domain-containing protein n=1 Tax=Flavobacterium sediminilitoris TaxID=2024526 RepID=A0ABY4HMP0_9FLAO|nr:MULTISPECIES: DUF6576 domain-containing protein [Flavobacterium]UOX33556.1 hypothetical protein LXD69_16170 [Flavobacterium sediminilitoris]